MHTIVSDSTSSMSLLTELRVKVFKYNYLLNASSLLTKMFFIPITKFSMNIKNLKYTKTWHRLSYENDDIISYNNYFFC